MSMTVFPSTDGWITPRTDEVKLTDQNCKIVVSKPIDYINKVLIIIDGEVNVRYQGSNGDNFMYTDTELNRLYYDEYCTEPVFPIDITKYVVEYEKYKTLFTTTVGNDEEITKLNTWYYTRKTDEIVLPNDTARWYEGAVTVTERLILQELQSILLQYGNLYFLIGNGENTSTNRTKLLGITSFKQFTTADIMNARFRVYYEPLGESIKLNTLKQTPVKNEFAIPFSQQQQIVNNLAFGNNMQAMANRTGVETRTVCRKVKQLNKVRQIGSVWKDAQGNKWRLTSQDIDFSCGYANCTETWSKNWTMQSEFVGINREFRSWNIPADTVKRNLLIEDYCYLTEENDFPQNSQEQARLSANAITSIFQSFDTENATLTERNTEITVVQINTSNMNNGQFETSIPRGLAVVSAIGFGNSFVLSAKTKDNLSLGTQRTKSTDDGSTDTKRYCRDVYYTDENGRIDAISLYFSNTVSDFDADYYPQTTIARINNATETINRVDQNWLARIENLKIDKDESEQLSFTYQMHFLTHIQDIVIGAGLCSNLLLVKNREENQFKYWDLTDKLPQGAQTMTSQWGTERQTPATLYASAFGKSIYVQPMSCLTDSKNNIIIANNSNEQKRVWFNFTRNYNAMQEYYDSKYGSQYRDAIAQ